MSNNSQSPFSNMFQQAMNEPEAELEEEIERIQQLQESGRYTIEAKLEGGGMKSVSVQNDAISDRKVVIAELRDDKHDPESIKAFLREASLTGRIAPPNIVPVHEIGVNEAGLPYYTMKYIEGRNLAIILNELAKDEEASKTKLDQNDLLSIFEKICQAIAYAHSKNIVHLDLKPENILVSDFGQVQVCDWGLARDLNDTYEESGMITGTPGFISPEQILQKNIDKASDIYALGAILFAILTLEPPLSGNDVQTVISKTLKGDTPSPINLKGSYGIPIALNAICSKAMEVDPEKRYETINELIADIGAFRNDLPTKAHNPGVIFQGWLFIKRNLVTSVVTFLMIIILGIVTMSYINRLQDAKVKHELTATKTAPHYYNEALKDYGNLQFEHALRKIKIATKYMETKDYNELKVKLLISLRRLIEARHHFQKQKRYDKRMLEILELFQHRQDRHSDEFIIDYIEELNKRHLPGIVNNVMYLRNKKIKDLKAELPFIHRAMQAINQADSYSIKIVDNKIHFKGLQNINRIEPLAGLPIEDLRIQNASIRKLSPLKGSKDLKYLDIRNTMIGSLDELAGHELDFMDISGTLVSNFETLYQFKVKHIKMRGLKVLQLSALLKKPEIASVELDEHRFYTKYDKNNIK